MQEYLKKYQINSLINSNADLKEGYEYFRKEYPYEKIIDMYSHMHNWKPIVEVTIEFIYSSRVYRYEYYHESGETPKREISRY